MNLEHILKNTGFIGGGAVLGGAAGSSILTGVGFVIGGPIGGGIGFGVGCLGGIASGAIGGHKLQAYVDKKLCNNSTKNNNTALNSQDIVDVEWRESTEEER